MEEKTFKKNNNKIIRKYIFRKKKFRRNHRKNVTRQSISRNISFGRKIITGNILNNKKILIEKKIIQIIIKVIQLVKKELLKEKKSINKKVNNTILLILVLLKGKMIVKLF